MYQLEMLLNRYSNVSIFRDKTGLPIIFQLLRLVLQELVGHMSSYILQSI
jgi:hypothetical protein